MTKIIRFESDYTSQPKYQNALREIISQLGQLEEEAISFSINLATAGKWRDWDSNVKVGEKFKFTEDMLKDTGDPNVDKIAKLVDEIISTQEKLKNALIE